MSKHSDSRRRRTRGLAASFVAVALGFTGLVALATGSSATQTPVVTEWHTWATTLKPGVTVPEDGGDVTWPQTYVGAGQLAPQCGVWYQQDLYKGTRAAIDALYADGKLVVLGNGKFEDHQVIQDWTFSYTECEEVPVEVAVEPAAYTAPSCEAPGTLVGVNTANYQWSRNGTPDTAAVLTATAIGDVTLTGTTVFGPYDLTQLTDCTEEQPTDVAIDPAPVYTPPTCTAPGTLVGVNTANYQWSRNGTPDTAAVLTATAIGDVTLTGQTVYGPHNLTQLTGEVCLSNTPVLPETAVVPTAVTPTALAETGLPLLGVLGLAGSFSLIGGGLLNAGRVLRNRH